MITQTNSATPLPPVVIARGGGGIVDVWLHADIAETVDEDGQATWAARTVHYRTHDAPTVAQVEAEFGRLWAIHSGEVDLSPAGVLAEAIGRTSPEVLEAARTIYAEAVGRQAGDAWRPVTGYHDAYALAAEVTHGGKTWVSTRDGASGEPGASPDWREKQAEGQVVDWVQPHAGSEYAVGAVVRHKGRIWRNDHTGPNGWEPGATGSQWTDIGPA